jgi:hypothetical protein
VPSVGTDVFLLLVVSGALFVASAGARWRVWPHAKRSGTDARAGLALAAAASAPSVLFCFAAGASILLQHLTGRWYELPPLTIVPATLGTIASPALILMSFRVTPPRSMSPRLEYVRLGWGLLWIATSLLVAGEVLANCRSRTTLVQIKTGAGQNTQEQAFPSVLPYWESSVGEHYPGANWRRLSPWLVAANPSPAEAT